MAISICSRQFQFAHGNFSFSHGNFNFAHGNFKISANIGHAGCQVCWEILKYMHCKVVNYICHLANQIVNLCFEFRDLRVKKVVNSNVAVMLF